MKLFSTFLMLLAMAVSVSAHDFEVDGIYYLINGSEATVTYKGSDPNEYENEYSGRVIIPAEVTYNDTTYNVTSIGESAFRDCLEINSVIIPEGVKNIGDRAFWGCTSLTHIGSKATLPPTCGIEALKGIQTFTCHVFVPSIALNAYKNADQWDAFFNYLIEGDEVEDIISHSTNVIRGAADIKPYSPGFKYGMSKTLIAKRVDDRLNICGLVPKCDMEKSKLHYTICDSIVVLDFELVFLDESGTDEIQVDFGPLTADAYTLYVRYNGSEINTSSATIGFEVPYYAESIFSDGFVAFPIGLSTPYSDLSILTEEPKVGEPVTVQLDADWYGGIENLSIDSIYINGDNIKLKCSCRYESGSPTHVTTTVTIDSIQYPGEYLINAIITDAEAKLASSSSSIFITVTADEGWDDPRTMSDFLQYVNIPSSIKEGETFQIEARWSRLLLPSTTNQVPIMQVDSVIGSKVFVSVHYDTTVEIPYDSNYLKSVKISIPGLKQGQHTIVFTGVDEAGRYNYASYEIEIYVDYITYQGTFGISDDECYYVDEEGRNDLTFDFVGDSLHVQGLLWMQCNNPKEVYYQINGELIQCRVKLKNSRDMSAARYHVDFYLSPCPLDEYSIMVEGRGQNRAAVCDTFYVARQPDSSIWVDGSQWDAVYYDSESDNGSDVEVGRVTYSLRQAEDGCLALEKTVSVDGVTSDAEVQGYIRNDHDTLIYVRPVLADGTIGEECLLYDFRKPFEYDGTVRYGVLGGEVVEERIDWNAGTLDYFMLKGGDKHCLPAWKDIIYGYGCLGGPMELFMQSAAPQKKGQPKPTNISHVIFTTKGGQKTIHMRGEEDEQEIEIPYDEMLQTGTVWECLEVSAEEPDCMHTYTIQVQGDVMIAGRLCKQVYSPEKGTQLTLFEEGRKVYIVNADETPEVLFDFGLQRGDILADESCVIYTDMIQNQGYDYRRIGIDTNLDCCAAFADDTTPWSYDLIEGIGVSKDEHLPGQRPFSEERTISYLLRCWRGNTLVYQSSAYDYLTGINALRQNAETPLYDLQGRPTSHPAPGIYIQDGHKVMKR